MKSDHETFGHSSLSVFSQYKLFITEHTSDRMLCFCPILYELSEEGEKSPSKLKRMEETELKNKKEKTVVLNLLHILN